MEESVRKVTVMQGVRLRLAGGSIAVARSKFGPRPIYPTTRRLEAHMSLK